MYKSNNWKKMHHIPIKSKTINGYEIKIIKLNEYCSPRSKKKKKKFRLKHCFTPNYKDILALMERSRNMAKEKKKELLPGYHWECKYCDGRHAKQSPYERGLAVIILIMVLYNQNKRKFWCSEKNCRWSFFFCCPTL